MPGACIYYKLIYEPSAQVSLKLLLCSQLLIAVILFVSHFGFKGRTLVLIVPMPGHCSTFYLIKAQFYNTFSQRPH